MNKNLFWYTIKEELPVQTEGEEKKYKETKAAFNVNNIIRVVTLNDKVIVLLDDIHERLENSYKGTNKNGKPVYVKERNTFQSEIYLSLEDAKELEKVTSIN